MSLCDLVALWYWDLQEELNRTSDPARVEILINGLGRLEKYFNNNCRNNS